MDNKMWYNGSSSNTNHKLNEKGHTVIIVTHDLDIANQCDSIIEISDGIIKACNYVNISKN